MTKYLIAVIAVLLFSNVLFAQDDSSKKGDDSSKEEEELLTSKDRERIKDFTPNIKNVEILCVGKSCTLKVVFDQTFSEIKRVTSILEPEAKKEDAKKTTDQTTAEKTVTDGTTAEKPEAEKTATDEKKPSENMFQRLTNVKSYVLMDLASGEQLNLSLEPFETKKKKAESNNDKKPASDTDKEPNYGTNILRFRIGQEIDLKATEDFALYVRSLKFADKVRKENPSMASVAVSNSVDTIPEQLGKADKIKDETPPAVYEYAITNFELNKSNPEVKVSFGMNGERVTSPFYSTLVVAEPFELKRLGLRGAYSVVPFFVNLEKNDTPGSEVDKLRFGGKFKHLFVFEDDGKYSTDDPKTTPFIGIKSEVSAQIETTTKFKEANLIFGLKTGFPINLYQTRSHSMRLTPFVGFDVGRRILDAELDAESETKQKWIARPSVGAEFYYTPARTETEIPYLFEATFIHRIFLKPEEIYTRNADREPIVEGLSTNPKSYLTAQFTLWSSKFFSPFIRYTYGRDAPRYLLEDHKYMLGVTANFDWGSKK